MENMYSIMVNNKIYIFTNDQQWQDNETFSVIAICDNDEYCVDYYVPDISEGEEDCIDWESPSLISRLSDGEVMYKII